MNILALETSSDACSMALMFAGKHFQKHHILPQQHTEVLLDWISELLDQADTKISDLHAIAYSCGPGSFSGIRTGAAISLGMALPEAKPLLAIPSLQVIAQGIYREQGVNKVMPLMDARMGQVYCGRYALGAQGLMEQVVPDQLLSIDQVDFSLLTRQGWLLVTDIKEISHRHFYPHAGDVLSIAQRLIVANKLGSLDNALPIYLRTAESWKKSP